MTPADDSAYAALNLPPGSSWPEVHEAWRRLVKAHHPDRNHAADVVDLQRLREANEAHLRLRAALGPPESVVLGGPPARLGARRTGEATRAEVWDRVWNATRWQEWAPGVLAASSVAGGDRRASVEGCWEGRRWSAVLVFCDVSPLRRLGARVLELRCGRAAVALGVPPRIRVRLSEDAAGTTVELVLECGDPATAVALAPLAGALDTAACRLLGIAETIALAA